MRPPETGQPRPADQVAARGSLDTPDRGPNACGTLIAPVVEGKTQRSVATFTTAQLRTWLEEAHERYDRAVEAGDERRRHRALATIAHLGAWLIRRGELTTRLNGHQQRGDGGEAA